jgi:hypothetical protein
MLAHVELIAELKRLGFAENMSGSLAPALHALARSGRADRIRTVIASGT